MKRFLGGRVGSTVVAVAITASLTTMWGPGRSSVPVLASGADKIAISASTQQWVNQNQQPNANTATTVTLASTTFSTSTTEDLVMTLSTECGLYTAVGAKNNNTTTTTLPVTTSSTAVGQVMVWLQLDGHVVPVSAAAGPAGPGNGPVSFCSRALNLNTSNLSPQQMIQISENTLDANSFQWFSLNVGNGTHTLNAYATLIANTQSSGTNGGTGSTTGCDGSIDPTCEYTTPSASALVGQRTLEVFPDHLAPTASF